MQYLRAYAVISLVGAEAQVDVGVHRIVALLLQLVCSNLVHQSYAASLLAEVYDSAAPFLLNHLHCLVELFAAVASLAAEGVARQAAAVHAHHDGFARLPTALDEGYVLQAVALLAEGDDAEVSVGGRHVGLYAFLHERFLLHAVGNEVLDGDYLQSVAGGNLL